MTYVSNQQQPGQRTDGALAWRMAILAIVVVLIITGVVMAREMFRSAIDTGKTLVHSASELINQPVLVAAPIVQPTDAPTSTPLPPTATPLPPTAVPTTAPTAPPTLAPVKLPPVYILLAPNGTVFGGSLSPVDERTGLFMMNGEQLVRKTVIGTQTVQLVEVQQ